jgi:hypothetical protein
MKRSEGREREEGGEGEREREREGEVERIRRSRGKLLTANNICKCRQTCGH